MLRHTFASSLASSGVSLYELQKLLTHGSSAMTQRYSHLTDQSLKNAASRMDGVVKTAGQSKVVSISGKE